MTDKREIAERRKTEGDEVAEAAADEAPSTASSAEPESTAEVGHAVTAQAIPREGLHSTAINQLLASFERWTSAAPHQAPVARGLSTLLWDRSVVAGTPGQYVVEQAMLKASQWATLSTVEDKARYISRALGHRTQPKIPADAPKLCPKGGGKIEALSEVQSVAPRLMRPGGPIRRLLLQIPPGAGKTCTYLAVLAQFVGNGHTIVIVGDDDIFAVFKEGLRQCPAKVKRNMVEKDGKTRVADTVVYLRDINPHMSAFCTLKCAKTGNDKNLQGDPYTCGPEALTWLDTHVYFFTFVMAGNWLQAWSGDGKKAKNSMYMAVNPYSNMLLLLIDEGHKLTMPSMEQTTSRWKVSAALLPKYIASLGVDPRKNPYILIGTGSVNTTQLPPLSLCLPIVIKGKGDETLREKGDFNAPPRVNLHHYLQPKKNFVTIADRVKIVAYPPPGVSVAEEVLLIKDLKARLQKFRGFAIADSAAAEREDTSHPCPVSTRALREASYTIYRPIDNERNRKLLLDIWAGVAYIVDMSQDFRYYPTPDEPYPKLRAVSVPEGAQSDAYTQKLKEQQGHARWSERSQFACTETLRKLVEICLKGEEELDLREVEAMAPKWKAVADDLLSDARLTGQTMIFPGAFFRKDCDDNLYLVLLTFYLQKRLQPFVEKHCRSKKHQLVTLESVGREEALRDEGPAIYIIGDSAEGKYQPLPVERARERVEEAYRAQKIPAAADFVMAMSTKTFRERQYFRYNEEVCPSTPQQAAGNTIVILAEGGHKALDLKCTTNGLILTTMPGGKFRQTQGRVKRSCAFKALADASMWRVHVRVYLLWAENCIREGPVLDQVLHSFYHEQYQIIRYLEMLQAMAGVGCSNWEVYSNWKQTFSDFGQLEGGGFRCAHDADLASLNEANERLRDFFFCGSAASSRTSGETEAEGRIQRGISGDVSVEMVQKSTQAKCAMTRRKTALQKLDTELAIRRTDEIIGRAELRYSPYSPTHRGVHFTAPTFDEDGDALPAVESLRVFGDAVRSSQLLSGDAVGSHDHPSSSDAAFIETASSTQRVVNVPQETKTARQSLMLLHKSTGKSSSLQKGVKPSAKRQHKHLAKKARRTDAAAPTEGEEEGHMQRR